MGDDSKGGDVSGASSTKEDRPSRDYFVPITPKELDGSNYASWPRSVLLTITDVRMGEPMNVFYKKLHVILQEIDCLHPQ
ncbi:unnamed protein product [Prunus brigantina]